MKEENDVMRKENFKIKALHAEIEALKKKLEKTLNDLNLYKEKLQKEKDTVSSLKISIKDI